MSSGRVVGIAGLALLAGAASVAVYLILQTDAAKERRAERRAE